MSPAAAPSSGRAGGHHVEAVKTMDASELLIPSQLAASSAATGTGGGVLAIAPGDGGAGGVFGNHGTLTGQELAECARMLGIDVIFDTDLLYIAEELLTSPLPGGWERYTAGGGKQYYYNTQTRVTQWAHPLEEYYRCLVYMRKDGDAALETKALDNPPTPDEVREMAKYLGVDYRTEFELLDICKAAVNAPLPPEWEEYEDENGEMYYLNKISKQQLENHPLDGYFIEVIRQRRGELASGVGAQHEPRLDEFWEIGEEALPYPWMEFVDGLTGQLYYYNFRWDAICHSQPHRYVQHQLRTRACIMIQSLWRGYHVRQTHRLLVLELAAKDIQRLWRGFKARKQYRNMKDRALAESAMVLQALFRGRKVRMDRFAHARNVSASLIQSRWRAHMQNQKIRREAARLPLPELPTLAEYDAPSAPLLGLGAVLDRVDGLADELLAGEYVMPGEMPLESCDADGEPIVFPWMRPPKTGPALKRLGSTGRSRPRRASQTSSTRGSARGPGSRGASSGSQRPTDGQLDGGAAKGEAHEAGGALEAEMPPGVAVPSPEKKGKKGKKGKGRPVKRKEKSPGKKRDKSPGNKHPEA